MAPIRNGARSGRRRGPLPRLREPRDAAPGSSTGRATHGAALGPGGPAGRTAPDGLAGRAALKTTAATWPTIWAPLRDRDPRGDVTKAFCTASTAAPTEASRLDLLVEWIGSVPSGTFLSEKAFRDVATRVRGWNVAVQDFYDFSDEESRPSSRGTASRATSPWRSLGLTGALWSRRSASRGTCGGKAFPTPAEAHVLQADSRGLQGPTQG